MAHSSSDEELMLVVTSLLAVHHRRKRLQKRQKVNRKWWVQPSLIREEHFSAYHALLDEMRAEEVDEYKHFLRIDKNHFDQILAFIRTDIEKEDTLMRTSIPPAERLAVTLRFLASGDSYSSLSFLYRISHQTIGRIVPETCEAIYNALEKEYLKVPDTQQKWETIAADFEQIWQFPNCVGAIDGKHIALKVPKSISFRDNKAQDFHSLVLLAIVDAHHRFVFFDLHINDLNDDGGVYSSSSISSALENNTLHIPPPKMLPGWHTSTPHVILGGEAFQLKPFLMRSYPGRAMTKEHKVFNNYLHNAKRASEKAFHVLVNRFAVLGRQMNMNQETAITITQSCLALNNFLRTENDEHYAREIPLHTACAWYRNLGIQGGNRSGSNAQLVRDYFCDYFNSVATVSE